MKIGIIGAGFVGAAMKQLSPGIDIIAWDLDESKRLPLDITFAEFVHDAEVIFVAVPTPMSTSGSCCTDIVESVIADVRSIDSDKYIVIRSTVPPGTSKRLGVSFIPEFLTEKNWKLDFIRSEKWIIGTEDNKLFKILSKMFLLAEQSGCIESSTTEQYTATEAELIKYTANCFLATKISFFNEIYELCEVTDIDFNNILKFCHGDERIGSNHTLVPGHDGHKGYGGTCFPKDMNALLQHYEANGIESYIIKAAVDRNEHKDRPEKDWKSDKGRAVI